MGEKLDANGGGSRTPSPSPFSNDLETWRRQAREHTPARLFVGRAGGSYPTATALELRADHAFARDAVQVELNLEADLGAEMVERLGLFEVSTKATTKQEFLLRPDLGRSLSDEARAMIMRLCPAGPDVQVFVGDGLSAAAVRAQVPSLLPALLSEIQARGWTAGQPFVVRHCRVGVLNEVGELLRPSVAVLLIGERPGLATAESLSAYLAYRPQAGHDDSKRNLISNIHARGVPVPEAARRVAELAGLMMARQASGVELKEGTKPPLSQN